MKPLDGPRLKISRAKEHLDFLHNDIRRFIENEPYIIVKYKSNGLPQISIEQNRLVPANWGLIVGDIVFSLRASLDYIVWQLSLPTMNKRRSQGKSITLPQFPICDRRTEYIGVRGNSIRFIRYVPKGHRHIIEQLQPYHRTKWPELALLSILRDTNNADKHRVITPVFAELVFRLGIDSRPFSVRFNSDSYAVAYATSSRIELNIADNLYPDSPLLVVFGFEENRSGSVKTVSLSSLYHIYDFISDEVIPFFASKME